MRQRDQFYGISAMSLSFFEQGIDLLFTAKAFVFMKCIGQVNFLVNIHITPKWREGLLIEFIFLLLQSIKTKSWEKAINVRNAEKYT